MEEWKKIEGFEEYEVSTLGNVRRGGKLLKGAINRYGYWYFNLYKNGIIYNNPADIETISLIGVFVFIIFVP